MEIRAFEKGDIPIRVEWMNDPDIYMHMGFTPPITLENTIKWYEKNKEMKNRVDLTYLDFDNNIMGFGGIINIDWVVGKGETYTFINPRLHGKGLGTKVNRLLIKYAFDVLKLNKLCSHIDSSNIASRRVREKLGFKLEGIIRDEKIENGQLIDRYYYGLLRREYSHQIFSLEEIKIDFRKIGIVRDDLYPQTGGGIKSRKASYYEELAKEKKCNAFVTTGGIQSNHNRAIALMCAKNEWKCHIVYHGSKERFEAEKGNALIVRKSGATYKFVEADQIGPAMDAAIQRFKDEGFNPMYIHGGGHDLPGGIALVDAVKELKKKCDEIGYKPQYIFHASGTGSTQAGIAVGLDLVGWSDVKLIGISVARQKERGTQVIVDFANELASHYGLDKDYKGHIDFNTDYLCGGYEKYTPEMSEYLDGVMRKTGIMFDTTYSGKAFYGMMDYIKKNNITENVLFWHTGGLMNLMK